MSELNKFVIATRESPLAMWQALHVQARLRDEYPAADIQVLGMTTRGDQILDKTLSKVGGKGLFVKELECMRGGRTWQYTRSRTFRWNCLKVSHWQP